MKINIDEKEFKTQRECIEFIRNMIASGNLDHQFLLALLERHDSSEEKIGCGIHRFFTSLVMGNNALFFERIDGTICDFSFYKCVKKQSHKSEIMSALRFEIKSQIKHARNINVNDGIFLCSATGIKFSENEMHIDHWIPFLKIVEMWIEKYKICIDNITTIESEDGIGRILENRYIAETFKTFHREHAILKPIHKKINLRLGKKNRSEEDYQKAALFAGITRSN